MTHTDSIKEMSERIYQRWVHSKDLNQSYKDLEAGRSRPLSMQDIRLASSLLDVLGLEELQQEHSLAREQER